MKQAARAIAAGLFLSLALCLAAPAAAADGPEGRLLRFPDIHGDFVVFVYAGDLWRAPSSGGPAWRLTAHAGMELFPKISPDGEWIAFSAEYTGTRQVWVMPSWGGTPKQLTFYNDVGPMPPRGGWDDWVLGWTKDGKILVRMNRVPWNIRMGRYYVVDPKGGLETPLDLPEGGSASFSPDGKRFAYCPVDREFRTWKRTKGGRAQDVWIWDFAAKKSEKITDWIGTDNFPMWAGNTIYFTSDREHTLNIFAYDTKTKATKKVTSFDEYDVLWPSLGSDGKAIVFMNGGWLYRLDLATSKADKIAITLPDDFEAAAPHFKDVKDYIQGSSLSPGGARAVFDARGELFTVPAKDGATRNLTLTQGVRERGPAWSPDGKWIAYLSDATGEYEIWVRAQDGSGEPRRLTSDGGAWKFDPVWSPDSKLLAFGDRARRLRILDVGSGAITDVDKGRNGDLNGYTFSPDGKWLAYESNHASQIPAIAVYSLEQKKAFVLGDGQAPDREPVFSADGKYLFFLSDRDYHLAFSSFEFNYVYDRSTRIYAAALTPDAPALFPPKSDEEKGKGTEEKSAKKEGTDERKNDPKISEKGNEAKSGAKEGASEASSGKKNVGVRVVPDGFMDRTVALPGVKPGAYRSLSANGDAVFYVKVGEGEDIALYRFDLKERKEEKVLDGIAAYQVSADGKKILYRVKTDWFIADSKASLKAGDGKLDLAGLRVKLDQRAEWKQMFEDGWRVVRDWFYDPKMHGVDWALMKKRYGALVPFLSHRADLDFLFGEMMGELESGHTYVASGDEPKIPRVLGGMLGCELAAESGRYRIAKIFPGENWDDAWRSPLTEPGVNVKEGSFLLAIDGQDLTTADNPYRLLEGKAVQPLVLTISDKPSKDGARTVTVRPISSEANLRYLDWVKSRMAMAEKLSGGKVGYIHLPDTAISGNRMLQKLFYSQSEKPALVIDDRYNGGGFIPDRMIEYFARRPLGYWARRDMESLRTPGFAHVGPKAMLANGYSSSGGDALPYFFRLMKLGPIIGTRTWGGLIGLSGNPNFVDGGQVQVPSFRIYDSERHWAVENEGVAPDIEVVDLPERVIAGGDPSLEKAVEVLLEELKKNPGTRPAAPVPPDMTKKK